MANSTRRSPMVPLGRLVLLVVLSLALGLFAGLVAGITSGQKAQAAQATAGHTPHVAETAITGVVVNGTHSGMPVGNLTVTLQATDGRGTHDAATTTTDAGGHFTFANLADADTSVFAVYTRFQQGFFSTGGITVDNGTQGVTLTVYDATSDPSTLHITSMTALVRDPRPKNGLIRVGEYYTFHNSGAVAFVGTSSPAGVQPMGLLRFALPPGATNLTLGAGFTDAQSAQVPTGFGATATVPPGDSQFAFAFDVPYTATACTLTFKAEYPADHLLVLVPPAYRLDTQDLTSRGPLTASGDPYNAYTRDTLPVGTLFSAQVLGLPAAGESPNYNFAQLVALAAVLALLLILAVALYLRRGKLAGVLRLVQGPALLGAATLDRLSEEERAAERERLLRRLLVLERSETARRNGIGARQEAAQVRASLRALLAGDGEPRAVEVPAGPKTASREAPGAHDDVSAESSRQGTAADGAEPSDAEVAASEGARETSGETSGETSREVQRLARGGGR